jgi:MtN3 and saliva related transmembrane protein
LANRVRRRSIPVNDFAGENPAGGAGVTTEIIGWASSIILLATLIKQVHKQWREGSSEGVSRWLFAGQTAASLGFTIYSVLVKNWVFVVTNALLLVNALIGWVILFRNKKNE